MSCMVAKVTFLLHIPCHPTQDSFIHWTKSVYRGGICAARDFYHKRTIHKLSAV